MKPSKKTIDLASSFLKFYGREGEREGRREGGREGGREGIF